MATPPHEQFLAVLKASYDYEPQSDDEITIKEDQILLLIEKVDDDWWKVKVKGSSQDEDGLVGLVPAAYVEPAEHTAVVKALYDYQAAANGELSIQEDEVLYVFEMEEEWVLVQDEKGTRAGYIPGNYVEEVADQESNTTSTAPPMVVVPDSPPLPTAEYVDPEDRVRQTKVTADDVQIWPVSEIDKKGKKKKGTLGVGSGSIFFASESDKTPVQRWQTKDVTGVGSEKAKHVQIEIGGPSATSLHFHAGSKDNAEAIIRKLESSRSLATPAASPAERNHVPPASRSLPPPLDDAPRAVKKPSVHFSSAGPDIIPSTAEEHEDSDVEELHGTASAHPTLNVVALYDFTADGEDELSVKEGEVLVILEKDGDEWWKCRNAKGVEGVVPASYLEESANGPAEGDDDEDEDDRVNAAAAAAAAEEARKAEERAKALAAKKEAQRLQEEENQREEKRKQAEARKLEAERKAKEAARLAEQERRRRKEAADTQANGTSRKERPDSTVSSGRPSGELTLPAANKVRTWHDRSGQFRVDAEFLGFNNGKLKLHKTNGVIVEVPSEKMSLEDMHFVERFLDKEKKARPSNAPRISEDDIPLAIAKASTSPNSSQKRPSVPPKKGPEIDWFDFFLSAGCDMDLCTRYAQAFERDKIDESILGDLTEGTLRSLGLKEGDIIRVKKAIQQRKPQDNLVKPSPRVQQQIKSDEELAWQLQQQEAQSRGEAPNLFVSGPGGALKQPRRGRPQPSKSVPTTVDISAISSPTISVPRTTSPKEVAGSARVSTPVSAPARPPSAPVKSGFEDDDQAWAIRPSSAKPQTPAPVASPPAPAQPVSAAHLIETAPATQPAVPAVTASPPPAAPAKAASPPASSGLPNLAKTTESDIFDQLARLSELRKSSTPSQPVVSPVSSMGPASATTPTIPAGYHTGMGAGASPIPMGQFAATPPLASPPPQMPYNGPRGPYAPVASNAPLLQPLIPTHTGFNGFVPTTQPRLQQPPPLPLPPQRPQLSPPIQNGFGQGLSPFQGVQPQQPMQTGFVPSLSPFQPMQQQPMLPQQTGMVGNFNPTPGIMPFQQPNGAGFNPVQSHMTGFNPSAMGLSPFGNPPPVPPLPNNMGGPKDNSPANIFAQMKSGTFAMDS